MEDRQKAIEELQKQIKLGRERLGPKGLKELERLSQGLTPKGGVNYKSPEECMDEMIPYDKETALKALEIYLENHGDPEALQQKILELANKKLKQ